MAFIFRSTPFFTLYFVRALSLRAYAYSFFVWRGSCVPARKVYSFIRPVGLEFAILFLQTCSLPYFSPTRFSLMNKEENKINDKSNFPQLARVGFIRKCVSILQQLIRVINLIKWRAPSCGEPIRKLKLFEVKDLICWRCV